jgi:hypothetical protein
LNPTYYGNPATFIATVTSGSGVTPTGAVNILDGGKQIGAANLAGSTGVGSFTTSSLAVGTHTITAAYQGDKNNGAATSAAITQVVSQAQTATAIAASPSPGIAGAPVSLTATVAPTQGISTPSGTVTFTDTFNGTAASLGSAALGAGGKALLHPILGVGAHSVVASFAGDADSSGSTSAPLALAVLIATTSTAVTSADNPSIVGSAVHFTAAVTGNGGIPTGSITFLADGKSLGSAPLNAKGTAALSNSVLSAGNHSITATYGGDANDAASTSAVLSQVVGTIPSVTALGDSSTQNPSAEVILIATVGGSTGPMPTGIVTFKAGTTTLGSASLNSSGVATFTPNLGLGIYSIVASYGGDATHSTSVSLPVFISGTANSFTVSINPPSVTMATTQNATVTVNLTSVEGFSDSIGLGCGSLPVAVTCRFSSPTVSLAANGTQTAQLTIDTDNPLGGGSSAMNVDPGVRGASMASLFFPLSVFFGCLLVRFRKRDWAGFTTILLLLLAGAAMVATGCSGFSQASATPGTYVIQVNGTGVKSNISHYQSFTLTITK